MLLDLNITTTTRLGFEPIKAPNGSGYLWEGIVPARIVDFHVTKQDPHKKGEFVGLSVPVLQIEFENLKLNPSDPDRFLTHSFKIVGTKKLEEGTSDVYKNRPIVDIENGTQNLWKTLKHFLENLNNSPNYRPLSSISKEDQLEYFDLPGIAPAEERIAKYEKFFNYMASFVNGNGETTKSQILDTKGEGLPIWVKVLPNYNSDPKGKNKFYTIPNFIGQGVFESLKLTDKGIPASGPKIIRVKPSESLQLTVAPIPGAANAGTNYSNMAPGGSIDPSVANLLK